MYIDTAKHIEDKIAEKLLKFDIWFTYNIENPLRKRIGKPPVKHWLDRWNDGEYF